MLIFKEKPHKYFMESEEYTSVSNVIAGYKNPFDSDFWSTYKALEKCIGVETFREMRKNRDFKSPAFIEWACRFVKMDDLIRTREEILAQWKHENKISVDKGNAYHLAKEKQAYSEGYETNPFTGEKSPTMMKKPSRSGDKKSTTRNLFDLPDGYYPELMIWNDTYKIAGTSDKVWLKTVKKDRLVYLDDYKTNKVIKRTNPYDKMKAPVHNMDDCNYNHYRLQIGTYAWMMEQFGFKVAKTSFIHFNERYNFSYPHLRKNVEALLNDFYNKKNNGNF